MAIQQFNNGDTGAAIRTKLNAALNAAVTTFVQARGFALPPGSVVERNGAMYIANAEIPDNTAFALGAAGATFRPSRVLTLPAYRAGGIAGIIYFTDGRINVHTTSATSGWLNICHEIPLD